MFQLCWLQHSALTFPRSPYGIAPNSTTVLPDTNEQVNHILLFTIFNPLYPITVVSGRSCNGHVTCSMFTVYVLFVRM